MGSTALDLALVAEGVAAASIAIVPKVWDVAAGMLLVREAGGVSVAVIGGGIAAAVALRGSRDRDR
jgi:myo-inositol-1(or 4)-monophosphatase